MAAEEEEEEEAKRASSALEPVYLFERERVNVVPGFKGGRPAGDSPMYLDLHAGRCSMILLLLLLLSLHLLWSQVGLGCIYSSLGCKLGLYPRYALVFPSVCVANLLKTLMG